MRSPHGSTGKWLGGHSTGRSAGQHPAVSNANLDFSPCPVRNCPLHPSAGTFSPNARELPKEVADCRARSPDDRQRPSHARSRGNSARAGVRRDRFHRAAASAGRARGHRHQCRSVPRGGRSVRVQRCPLRDHPHDRARPEARPREPELRPRRIRREPERRLSRRSPGGTRRARRHRERRRLPLCRPRRARYCWRRAATCARRVRRSWRGSCCRRRRGSSAP